MRRLERVHIRNFKSIRDQTLDLDRLNVFIGGNGAGKSNLIQAFGFLRELRQGRLGEYSQARGVDSLLYQGRRRSKEIAFHLTFADNSQQTVSNAYEIKLQPSDEGKLFVRQEIVFFHDRRNHPAPMNKVIAADEPEAKIATKSTGVAAYVRAALDSLRIYHFHDTSEAAAVRSDCEVDDNRFLHPDAGNLAAFLYYLKLKKPDHFLNIEETVGQIAPFFESFVLEPLLLNPERIRLEWKERGSDAYFNAFSLSDGTLRFLCLATLLLQPQLPAVLLLDEPELGLHPAAITLLASLLLAASERTQLLVATQSVTLVNCFEPEHIWVVDRAEGQSIFRHLNQQDMSEWLDDYSLGELWEKNVLGARP